MGQELKFDGKKYVSSKDLARKIGYTHDYISRLCREGKVDGRLVGRSWFVEPSSLDEHQQEKKEIKHITGKKVTEMYAQKEILTRQDVRDKWDELLFASKEPPQENSAPREESFRANPVVVRKITIPKEVQKESLEEQNIKDFSPEQHYHPTEIQEELRSEKSFFPKFVLSAIVFTLTLGIGFWMFQNSPKLDTTILGLVHALTDQKITIELEKTEEPKN